MLMMMFRLNYTPTEEPLLPEEGGIFQKFEEELEINDFPQQVGFLYQCVWYSSRVL